VFDGLSLLETMHAIPNRVHTIVDTEASSIAAVLLIANQAGHRIARLTSQIMLHEGTYLFQGGQESKIRKVLEGLEDVREQMRYLIANATGLEPDFVDSLLADDIYLTPREAADLNMIDAIIQWEPKVTRNFSHQIPDRWNDGATSRKVRMSMQYLQNNRLQQPQQPSGRHPQDPTPQ
jgi:ATP-dependent protease ClpP protease subunit